jgi:ABC-type Mn2+/Zn2+ transport system ATPase subunit
MAEKENVLTVSDLTVELNNNKIIEDLSFEVKKGETVVILGPNGAGKTTLLRALLGLIPYTGEIKWNCRNSSYLPPNELFQRKELIPLTVLDFYSLKNVGKKKALESITSVGLEDEILNRRISNLSTGQFQRLTIAWSLVDNPDVLLFDEPTAGIDIGGTETIYSLLHKFWEKETLSIILVTHDLNVVWEHADNVVCLNKKGICFGPPSTALTTEKLNELYGIGIKYYKHHR